MIHELNSLNVSQQDLQLLTESEALQNSSALQNKEVMLALSKIKLGQVLSGQIILEDSQTMLKLQSGLKLMAHLPNAMPSNQLLDFLVVGKGRQHLELEAVKVINNSKADQGLDNAVIKELQLPENQQMQKIVGEWIDQQLPFVKNQMVQLYQIAKHYQLPSETLTNLVANDIPLSDREASLVAQFKEKGTALLSHVMDEAMDHLTPDKGFELIKQLGDKLSFQDLKLTLENFLKGEGYHGVKDSEIAQNLEVNSQGKENVEHSKIEVLLNNLSQVKMGQEDSQDKMALLLKQMMGMMPKDKIKLFAEALVNKYLAIDRKGLTDHPQEEVSKLDESTKRMKEVMKEIQKIAPNELQGKEAFQTVEQMTAALEKYNQQGQYYCFPFQIGQEQTSGELYFFKPKKNKKGQAHDEGMYIVLALDMPSLRQVEVHLVQKGETLQLKIKVAQKEVQKQMEKHLQELRQLMDETLMPIAGIEVGLIEVPIQKKVSSTKSVHTDYRMDFRV